MRYDTVDSGMGNCIDEGFMHILSANLNMENSGWIKNRTAPKKIKADKEPAGNSL